MRRSIISVAAATLLAFRAGAQARPTQVDLTGPFVHAGGVVGSVTGQSASPGDTHAGGGWGAGGGISLTRSFAVVANYTIFNFRDGDAPSAPMEHFEAGARLRIGGVRTRAVFYLDGGVALRRASLATTRLFAEAPPNSDELVAVEGLAGWFGPGLQIHGGRRLAGEVSVAWAWGDLDRTRTAAPAAGPLSPVGLTTLRLRFGIVATVF